MEFILNVANESWKVLVDSAPWLLFGFAAAGLIQIFFSDDFVAAHLGKGKIGPIIKAALLGVPLPLCSCGVIPTAMGLRSRGASKPATLSFMISTPETGIDSILFTSALMDPVMTICRPLSAFVTAIFAGLFELFAGGKDAAPKPLGPSFAMANSTASTPLGLVKEGFEFAFGGLYGYLAPYLAVGIILAGAISALVPDTFFHQYLGDGLMGRLAMLVVATPMYICATASTPIAAAMIVKGLSPGAALVLLLAGPATNIATLTALTKMMGPKTTARYLFSICFTALFMGWLVDIVYEALEITPSAVMGKAAEVVPEWVGVASVILLAVAYARHLLSKRKVVGPCSCD